MLTCNFFRYGGPHLPLRKIPSSITESLPVSNGQAHCLIASNSNHNAVVVPECWRANFPVAEEPIFRYTRSYLRPRKACLSLMDKPSGFIASKSDHGAIFAPKRWREIVPSRRTPFSIMESLPVSHWQAHCLIASNIDHHVPKCWFAIFSFMEGPISF